MKKENILNSLIYGAIGDAYGAVFESSKKISDLNIDEIKNPCITDDTQLTLATCEAIIKNNKLDPAKIAEKYKEWFEENRITGIGASTLKALQELSIGGHWALVGRRGEMAAGNGAAMRIAPVGFLIDLRDDFSKVLIRDICRITHHNDEAYLGALSLIYIIQYRIQRNEYNRNDILMYLIDKLPDSKIRDRFIRISEENTDASISSIGEKYGSSGFVVESVPLAVFASTKKSEMDIKSILNEIISLGGDTDTISSMAMQLIGISEKLNPGIMGYFERIKDNSKIYKVFDKFADYCMLNIPQSNKRISL